jgi:hypothetical protein
MSDIYQIVLSLPMCSGRAVRFRQLGPTERDKVASRASRDIEEGATSVDFRLAELREGVKAMLVAVTKERVPVPVRAASPSKAARREAEAPAGDVVPAEDPLANPTLWEPLDIGKLSMPGPYAYDVLFKGKDDDLLCKMYSRFHEARPDEVELIAGKALPVSED